MALVHCPACSTKMSSVAKICPKCGYNRDTEAEIDPEQVRLFQKRIFRDRMYKLRMFSYVAMSITMVGALPMLWDYIRGIEQETPIIMLDHWGVYAIALGFLMYLGIRSLMVVSRKKYHANLPTE